MQKVVALTTIDNPFDPIKEFEDWNKYDEQHGYFSLSYLMRIANFSVYVSDDENDREIESAVDSIVRWNPLFYKKVVSDSQNDTSPSTS